MHEAKERIQCERQWSACCLPVTECLRKVQRDNGLGTQGGLRPCSMRWELQSFGPG